MNKLLSFLLLSGCLLAQQTNRYFDGYSGSLSSSSSVTLTWQQPATDAAQISFEGAATGLPAGLTVQCPGQTFTVSQSANGGAATATAGTIRALPGTYQPPQHTFWTSSNVGSGTAIAPLLTYTAGSIATLDWSAMQMGTGGTARNLSITVTNTGSGSCTLAVSNYVRERR